MRKAAGNILLIVGVLTSVGTATIIHIPQDQPTIQAGIGSAIDGDTVLVDTGRYVENINFNGKNIVVGSLFLTTRDTSYISQTVIDGNRKGSVVMFENGEDSTAVLTGFTITNGHGHDCLYCGGGGITCQNGSSPQLFNLAISGNMANRGGGIFCKDSSNSTLLDVIVTENSVGSMDWGGVGGGVFFMNSNPRLTNVTVRDNTASLGGGGMAFRNSSPTLNNVTITGNLARYGGGIDCASSSPELISVTLTENIALRDGGGMFIYSNSAPAFDPDNRCNIYLNSARSGLGSDLYAYEAPLITVVVDTFTVMNPTDDHAHPLNNFSFDILHARVKQVEADLYVDPTGNDDNSGLTPDKPLRTISLALSKIVADSLHPHTIYLSAGTYSPSNNGERYPLYWRSYVSLSGYGEGKTILDGEGQSRILHCYEANGFLIEKLTIQNGLEDQGAGIYLYNSSPSLHNVTVRANEGNQGGGIYCENSTPQLSHVTIIGNQGSGLHCFSSNPVLADVTISGNTDPHWGGGMLCEVSSPTLTNVMIRDNSSGYGGGVYCDDSSPSLNNVTIIGNTASQGGGGIFMKNGSKPTLTNVRITENYGGFWGGGGIYSSNSSPTLASVYITENTGMTGGGMRCTNNSNPTFDSVDRCSILLNHAGLGNDLYAGDSPVIQVIVDTFTVMNPVDLNAYPVSNFTFDILNARIEPVEADLYVSPAGDDHNSGLTPGEPLRTIAFAFLKTIADRFHPRKIHLAPGTYSRSTNEETYPLFCRSYVSLSGSEKQSTVLDGEGERRLLFCSNANDIIVERVTIQNGSARNGAGIFCRENSSLTLSDVIIKNNSASFWGGGVHLDKSDATLNDVTISGNSAKFGAGLSLRLSTPELMNVVITANIAESGGGIHCLFGAKPVLTNVTITGNSANDGGAIYCNNASTSTLLNSILWNDSPQEIYLYESTTPTSVVVSYSDIQGGREGITANNGTVFWLEGNIDGDPVFEAPDNGDFRLQEDSPCIDAGTALFIWEGDTLVDLPDNAYEGNAPDMGAFESPYSVTVDREMMLPTQFALSQPYPNPFNPTTNIEFSMPQSGFVTMTVYDLLGRQIITLVDSWHEAGRHSVQWNASNVPSGIYFIRMQTGDFSRVRKCMVIR